MGLSWGFLAAWDPGRSKFKAYVVSTGILLSGYIMDYPDELNLLNVYGPYCSKEQFCDKLVVEGTLGLPNLVIGGELNFTWSACEI